MKKVLFIAIILATTCVTIIQCKEETNINSLNNQITYLSTTSGGCNTNEYAVKSIYSATEDTVFFSFNKDNKLNLFVGLNYVCCAPFNTEVNIEADQITIKIIDSCEDNCYCKCICYYTWDFLFENFSIKPYHFKILLIDPRLEEPVIFREGDVDLSTIN